MDSTAKISSVMGFLVKILDFLIQRWVSRHTKRLAVTRMNSSGFSSLDPESWSVKPQEQMWLHADLGRSRPGRGWTIHTLNLVPFRGMKHGKGCTCTEIWFCCTVVLKTLADSCGIYNWGTAEAPFKGDGYRSHRHPTGRRHLPMLAKVIIITNAWNIPSAL